MKKLNILLISLLLVSIGFAQTPQQFKYQAVLRDGSGEILSNETVNIQIDILEGTSTGTTVFTELHSGITTTEQGLINLNIGSIEDLSVVTWNSDDYFIKISVDGIEMGTSQILSVPYAIHSNSSGVYSEMLKFTGTTDATNDYVSISFPTGWDKYNTRVLSFEIGTTIGGTGEYWRSIGATKDGATGSVFVSLSNSIWMYYPDADSYKERPYRLIIMKVE